MPMDKNDKADNKPEKRGRYKVVFKGQLLEGFSAAQVVSNIARLTKVPEEKIRKKFFSGKTVIIHRAHDESEAQKLQQLFTTAGLEVDIVSQPEIPTLTRTENKEISAEKTTDSINIVNKAAKILKGPILTVVALSLFVFVVINLWNLITLSVDAPDEIVQIEESLANESLVFLAHVDVERILSLHDYFVDDPDALPGSKSSLYNNLKKSGIDPRTSIKQMLTASYIEDKKLISQTIFLGDFSVQAVKQFFIKYYYAGEISDPNFTRLRIAELDPGTCQQGNFREVSIEADRILISNEGYLDDLHRLLKKSPGSVTDLNDWGDYRSDKLISMALFQPEQGKLLTSGMTAMMAQGMLSKNKPLHSLYAGIGMQVFPPGGLVDISLNSRNQSWLDKIYHDFTQQFEAMKTSSKGLSSLQLLLDNVRIAQGSYEESNGRVSVSLELDSDLKKAIELSISELTDTFFAGNVSSSVTASKNKVTEKIEAHPLHYIAQYNKAKLKPFDDQLDVFFKPAWIDGPFAVSVDELLFENEQIVLQLTGKGQNIKNVGNRQAALNITSVNDVNGNNLLAEAKCGEAANKSGTFFSSWGAARSTYVNGKQITYNEIDARQKVKLKQGVNFSQVASLQGQVELNLAIETQVEQFARTAQNKVLSAYGSRVLFRPDAADTLSYTLSGDESRVLAIRAMNKNKQYLSRSSRSAMDNLIGSGRSVTEKYQGEIAFVEVVYAQKLEKVIYPLEISKFPPYPSEGKWRYNSELVKTSTVEDWNMDYLGVPAQDIIPENNWQGEQQAVWQDAPFSLALYGLKTSKHWGTPGQLTIKTPVMDELRHNLSALEVYFNYPEASENGDIGKSYYYQLKAKGYYMNGKFIDDVSKPYMEGQLAFNLPLPLSYKQDQLPVKEISGDIIVHLHVSEHNSSHADMSIGAHWQDEGVGVKIVRIANELIEFEVTGNRSRLLQITLLGEEGDWLSTSDIHYGAFAASKKQEGNIIVNYKGNPVKALLTVSEGQQTRRYPFKLKL